MIIEVKNEAEMKQLGQKMGGLFQGGEVVELIGDVGAGKTTFAKGVALGLGIEEAVQSPSFTISRVYQTPTGLTFAHYDFYRLSDAGIMGDELHEALHTPTTITLVEWAGIVDDVLPNQRLRIQFETIDEHSRVLHLSADGELNKKVIEALR